MVNAGSVAASAYMVEKRRSLCSDQDAAYKTLSQLELWTDAEIAKLKESAAFAQNRRNRQVESPVRSANKFQICDILPESHGRGRPRRTQRFASQGNSLGCRQP
jgi:hypothetical protein